jgi:hypothetical protein
MMKIEGSGSGSIRQRHGSADPDPPLQNVMDPQHWQNVILFCHTSHTGITKLDAPKLRFFNHARFCPFITFVFLQ